MVVGVVMSQAEVVVVVLNFGMAEVLRVMEPKMRRESWLISIWSRIQEELEGGLLVKEIEVRGSGGSEMRIHVVKKGIDISSW